MKHVHALWTVLLVVAMSTGCVTTREMTGGGDPSSSSSAIVAFEYVDNHSDMVGQLSQTTPDGTPDAHLRLRLRLAEGVGINRLRVLRSNGGEWTSDANRTWVIGIYQDGKQINEELPAEIPAVAGEQQLDLYLNQTVPFFDCGQRLQVIAVLSDGPPLVETCTIP